MRAASRQFDAPRPAQADVNAWLLPLLLLLRAPGLAVRSGDDDAASVDGDVHGWL